VRASLHVETNVSIAQVSISLYIALIWCNKVIDPHGLEWSACICTFIKLGRLVWAYRITQREVS